MQTATPETQAEHGAQSRNSRWAFLFHAICIAGSGFVCGAESLKFKIPSGSLMAVIACKPFQEVVLPNLVLFFLFIICELLCRDLRLWSV